MFTSFFKNSLWVLAMPFCLGILAPGILFAATLTGHKPFQVSPKDQAFDFVSIDIPKRRFLAAHKQAGTLEVFDLATEKLLASVKTGEPQGVAASSDGDLYFTGNDSTQTVSVVNGIDFKVQQQVKVDGAVDGIAFAKVNSRVYAAQDNGTKLWVVDPKAASVVATIEIPGTPEFITYSEGLQKILLNIKSKDLLVIIDPATNKIVNTWSTGAAHAPHGLVIDEKRGQAYVSGKNDKLVALDLKSGKISSILDIGAGSDQIAYDPETKMIFSTGASPKDPKKKLLWVSKAADKGLEAVSTIEVPGKTHTLAVDPVDHSVWICYADKTGSYFQKFTLTP